MTDNEKETEILQALARGYCDTANAMKVLDPDLIQSMAKEVLPIIDAKDRQVVELQKEVETANRSAEKFKIMAEAKIGFGVWLCPGCARGVKSGTTCNECLEKKIASLQSQISALVGVLTQIIEEDVHIMVNGNCVRDCEATSECMIETAKAALAAHKKDG